MMGMGDEMHCVSALYSTVGRSNPWGTSSYSSESSPSSQQYSNGSKIRSCWMLTVEYIQPPMKHLMTSTGSSS